MEVDRIRLLVLIYIPVASNSRSFPKLFETALLLICDVVGGATGRGYQAEYSDDDLPHAIRSNWMLTRDPSALPQMPECPVPMRPHT